MNHFAVSSLLTPLNTDLNKIILLQLFNIAPASFPALKSNLSKFVHRYTVSPAITFLSSNFKRFTED